jgi:hypothetical protein
MTLASQFDWKDLVPQVIGLGAPLPAGRWRARAAAGTICQALGAAAATPQAVETAIAERSADSTFAAEAAQRAESEWLAALAEIGKAQVAEVGLTQRAELASEDRLQRWWRPLYALELSLIECPAFALTVLHALWLGHAAGIEGFASLSALLMTYFGARFGVLGVYVTGRSREKQASATGQLPASLIGALVNAAVKKK